MGSQMLRLLAAKFYKVRDSPFRRSARNEQNYHEIKRKCLEKGILFEDPLFPCTTASLGEIFKSHELEWKRPKDIARDPKFEAGGFSISDINQGDLGDSGFSSVLASLTLQPELLKQVVPPNQSFAKETYAGIFRFRFYDSTKWVEVVVDDRLPVHYYMGLVSTVSKEMNHFWSALLEKAYAKFQGGYDHLVGGLPCRAMKSLTNGHIYPIQITPKLNAEHVYERIESAFHKSSIVTCVTSHQEDKEKVKKVGMSSGHSYTITNIKETIIENKTVRMIRVRNPRGDVRTEKPLPGNNSKGDKKSVKKTEDCETWMSVEEFMMKYQLVTICEFKRKGEVMWNERMLKGRWTSQSVDPKIIFAIQHKKENGGKALISLNKKDSQSSRIGFDIYKVTSKKHEHIERATLDKPLENINDHFSGSCSEASLFYLEAGNYCIVPQIKDNQKQETKFVMKFLYEDKVDLTLYRAQMPPHLSGPLQKITDIFYEVSEDTHNIKVPKLKNLLEKCFKGYKFNQDLCKDLFKVYDVNESGTLTIDEYLRLWSDLIDWMKMYLKCREDDGIVTKKEIVEELRNRKGRSILPNAKIEETGQPLSFEETVQYVLELWHGCSI